MQTRICKIVIIILAVSLLVSCKNNIKPRTIYWSGTFDMRKEINDSTETRSFFIGYYIDLSDTGDVRMMKRKNFDITQEYYKINLTTSLKNTILDLAMNDSMYIKSNDSTPSLWHGYFYCLRFKYDTMDNFIGYGRKANQIQERLSKIMDSIKRHPTIEAETYFNLKAYEKHTENELIKIGQKTKDTVHFSKVIFNQPK